MRLGFAGLEFISKTSTAGVVYCELGFAPDFCMLISGHGGTNPNIYYWVNNTKWAGWASALDLLLTGSTGVVTRDTSGITVYAGGERIATAETDDTDGKHVSRTTAFAPSGHMTSAGVAVPADHQTAGGRNMLLAFRADL
jgi:hypothetical protein